MMQPSIKIMIDKSNIKRMIDKIEDKIKDR